MSLPALLSGVSYDDRLHHSVLLLRWGSAFFLLLFGGLGLYWRQRQSARREVWPRVPGEVIDENWVGYGAGGDSSYTAVVSFRTLEGTEVKGTPRGGMSLGLPVVGRQVPVWYDPADPQRFEARIHRVDRAGSMALMIAVVPAVLLVVSFLP